MGPCGPSRSGRGLRSRRWRGLPSCRRRPCSRSRRLSRACSAIQPLARPVGSTPPGMRQGSNQPPDSACATALRRRTSAKHGGASASSSSPRRSRLRALSRFHVLSSASASCSVAQATSRAVRAARSSSSAGRRSNDTTVPITCSAWRITGPPAWSRLRGAGRWLTGATPCNSHWCRWRPKRRRCSRSARQVPAAPAAGRRRS